MRRLYFLPVGVGHRRLVQFSLARTAEAEREGVSPDHVYHLPPGPARGLFRASAALLAATEALGLGVALLGILSRRTES